MKPGEWFLALILAIGFVLLASEVSPVAINALLVLVLVGMVLSRWSEIAPLVGLATKAAEGTQK
jgi:hypothetical protein